MVKNPPANTGDESSVPELGISPVEGNANSFQYSCLENHTDRGACGLQFMRSQESQT